LVEYERRGSDTLERREIPMDLLDQLRALGDRIVRQIDQIATEEAAKTAFVMPFIQALGFNIFDPTQVVPEFTADVGTKKGEKVDYAIMIDGQPMILFECKWEGAELDDKHMGQLFRYFSVTKARIGVLTNGVVYRFYSDLEDRNKMDARPFLVLDMRSINEGLVGELKRITKEAFDLDSMLTAAGELKYMREIRAELSREMAEPSEEFVRHFFSRVCPGRKLTKNVREQFGELVRRSFVQFIKENVDRRLESALSAGSTGKHAAVPVADVAPEATPDPTSGDDVVTTAEELEGYAIVKSVLREIVAPERIAFRDAKTYFAVLLDDNNRKPICRLWLNGARTKHLGLFREGKKEDRVTIENVDDIFKHAGELRATLERYVSGAPEGAKG
jgi:hypothetical protein